MNELKMSDKVEAFFRKAPPEAKENLIAVRNAILQLPIELNEDVKWGVPCYSHVGLVAGLGCFKKHIGLNFFQGVLLKDKFGVFDADSTGAVMRTIRIPHGAQPHIDAIADLVLQAAENNAKGIKADPKKTQSSLSLPDWFIGGLKQSSGVLEFFNQLPQTHQKEYLEYVSSAKKEETRLRRLAKSIDLMKKGSSLNDQYKTK